MKVGVLGLWHLGTVTAACLSQVHDSVIGVDEPDVVAALSSGQLPVAEPILDAIMSQSLNSGKLTLTSDVRMLDSVDLVIIAYDTPVDDNDIADVEFVRSRTKKCIEVLKEGATVLISSQVPVGFTAELARDSSLVPAGAASASPARTIHFAYSPENLRLGRAIESFKHPERIVVGTDSEEAKKRVMEVFHPFTDNFVWMSPASAEMTKHAINAYLGLSIAFINEIASICELVGANAKEVEQGLKTEKRIGPHAPLSPGGAFAGGTLARDVNFLVQYGQEHDSPAELLSAISVSNDRHKHWAMKRLQREFGSLAGKSVAVLGLTYKPGTNTLRRSSSVELCTELVAAGARVRIHDPSIHEYPEELELVKENVELCASFSQAMAGADAMILATSWPEYRTITRGDISNMAQPLVLDANGFLQNVLSGTDAKYLMVGKA